MIEFNQVLHMHWYLQGLGVDCYNHFCAFATELWPSSEVRLSSEQMDRILSNFVYDMRILTRSRLGLLSVIFSQICNRVMPLD